MFNALVLAFSLSFDPSSYNVASTGADTFPSDNLVKTTYVVATGEGPLDKVGVSRVRRTDPESLKGPLLLHAPLGYTTAWYELNEGSEYNDSFLGSLAKRGWDVWVVDDRRFDVPPGSCETGAVDCSAANTWNIQTRVDDAEFVRSTMISAQWPGVKPAIGGYVGGAIFATASVNAYPDAYSGLIAWQGSTYLNDPAEVGYAGFWCANIPSQGIAPNSLLQAVVGLATAAPNEASPIAPGFGFPVETTNEEIYFILFTRHFDSPEWGTPTFKFFTSVDDENGAPIAFKYAERDRVNLTASIADTYISFSTFSDLYCGLGQQNSTHYENLGAYDGRTLLMGSEFGFGNGVVALSTLLNGDVTLDILPDYGESDRFMSVDRADLADTVIHGFLNTLF